MNIQCRLLSTWRDPIGKPLTDRIITHRIKEGWYGEALKRQLLDKLPYGRTHGMVDRCGCGETKGVKWLTFKYLPKPGFYCAHCRVRERNLAIKNREQEKRFREKINIAEFA
jgi:hypothetical protein